MTVRRGPTSRVSPVLPPDHHSDADELALALTDEDRPGHDEADGVEGDEGDVGAVTGLEGEEGLPEGQVHQHAAEGADRAGESDQRTGTAGGPDHGGRRV